MGIHDIHKVAEKAAYDLSRGYYHDLYGYVMDAQTQLGTLAFEQDISIAVARLHGIRINLQQTLQTGGVLDEDQSVEGVANDLKKFLQTH